MNVIAYVLTGFAGVVFSVGLWRLWVYRAQPANQTNHAVDRALRKVCRLLEQLSSDPANVINALLAATAVASVICALVADLSFRAWISLTLGGAALTAAAVFGTTAVKGIQNWRRKRAAARPATPTVVTEPAVAQLKTVTPAQPAVQPTGTGQPAEQPPA